MKWLPWPDFPSKIAEEFHVVREGWFSFSRLYPDLVSRKDLQENWCFSTPAASIPRSHELGAKDSLFLGKILSQLIDASIAGKFYLIISYVRLGRNILYQFAFDKDLYKPSR